MDLSRVTVATVVDDRPPYTEEVAHLFASLERFGGRMRAARRRAYLIKQVSDRTARRLGDLGVDVRVVDEVDRDFRFANKLAMFAGEAAGGTDLLVAVDSDIVIAGDFSAQLEPGLLQAKQPDGDLLPIGVWERLFARFGHRLPDERHPTSLDPGWTHAYFNTGVVFAPGAILRPLHDRWLHHIRAIIDERGVVPGIDEHLRGKVPHAEGATGKGLEHLYFAEQWAFALARQELRIPYAILPLALNFPLITREDQRPGEYIRERFMPGAIRPLLLHHHHDLEGGLRATGYAAPDEVVARVNAAMFTGR